MADVFDLYVKDNRTIQFNLTEPIMLEDSHVSDWVFHIPRVLNNIDMSGWAWWLVYINARGQKYSELLELSEDPESPLEKCIATYTVDYSMSIRAGVVRFSLEAINADTQGTILNEWHTQTYQAKVQDTLQGNQVEFAETESDIISALLIEVQNKVAQLVGGATPEPVSLVADMTDISKVYLYVGSETGESTNYWYYYNGSVWVAGGLYASGITVDSVPTQGSTNAVSSGGVYDALHDTDTTLTQSGQAADAKKTGDEITGLKEDLNEINPIFSDYFETEQHTNVTTNNMAWTEGKYFDLNTGEEKSLNSYSHTDKFSCDAGDIIGIGLNTGQVLFWGANGYLSYVATSPSTAMQITAPTGATEYACNNRNVDYRPDTTTVSKTTETKSLITKAYDAPAQALLVDFENKKYASTTNGNLYSGDSYASYYCAYRFPCKPSHKYRTSTHTQVVYYDESKTFMSAYIPTINGNNATGVKVEMDFTTPDNCAYISINSNFANETVFDVEYVEYGNEKSVYNLIGKTVVCFGDSITGNYNFGDNYPYQIEEKTGAKVYNVGFGGCRMELTNETSIAYVNPFSMVSLADAIVSDASDKWSTQDANADSFAQKSWVKARLEILKSIDFSDVDIVTIAYGTNGIGLPIGNESNPLDTYSYAGATRYAIKTLLEKYPHLRIVLLTPIYRWYSATSDDGDTHQFSGQTLLDRVTKLLSVGAEIKIPTIDLYHTLGINKYNYTGYFGDDDETADGTHINSFGREQMGLRIAGELNRLF